MCFHELTKINFNSKQTNYYQVLGNSTVSVESQSVCRYPGATGNDVKQHLSVLLIFQKYISHFLH